MHPTEAKDGSAYRHTVAQGDWASGNRACVFKRGPKKGLAVDQTAAVAAPCSGVGKPVTRAVHKADWEFGITSESLRERTGVTSTLYKKSRIGAMGWSPGIKDQITLAEPRTPTFEQTRYGSFASR